MRYDETNDTTLLAVECWYCDSPFALVVAGDVRQHAGRSTLHLWNEGVLYERTPVEPMTIGSRQVTDALAGPYRIVAVGWRIAIMVIGLSLLGTAGALALERLAGANVRASLAWGVGGIGVGWLAGTTGDGGVFLLILGALAACVVGVALLAWRRTRSHAPGFILLPVLAFPALLWLGQYYPSAPAI